MLCWVVSPDFLWNFHDGLTTKSLVGPTLFASIWSSRRPGSRRSVSTRSSTMMLPTRLFMTFRVSEIMRETGERRVQLGVERCTFRDGKIAAKDVYRKPITP